jgi:hypothetical protein
MTYFSCQWVYYSSSLGIPFNCTYSVTKDSSKWSLTLKSDNGQSSTYTLTHSDRSAEIKELSIELKCRTANQLQLKVSAFINT